MLRRAREDRNMSIEDIASQTRIPQRHLLSLENGDFDALPGRTYSIGFAKNYARILGLSEATIVSQLREEMDASGHLGYQPEVSSYEPIEPSSIPPRSLVWGSAAFAALLVIGYVGWRTIYLAPTDLAGVSEQAEAQAQQAAAAQTAQDSAIPASAPVQASGPVVLTATGTVWIKIYDADGERLYESEMASGDSFTVPTDAKGPQILTGRPDLLSVTIGGKKIPPLGTAERTIADVPIDAASLLARAATKAESGAAVATDDSEDSAIPR
jgi:cytoskeletal protein RodZ